MTAEAAPPTANQDSDSLRANRPGRQAGRFSLLPAIAASVLLILLLCAAIGPRVAPHPPNEIDLLNTEAGISRDHPFGTDHLGRDVLSRILHGSRLTIAVGVFAVVVALIIGTVIGIVSGFYGGVVDGLLMRLIDAVWSIPLLALVLGVVAVLGRSLEVIICVVGVGFTPIFARLAATQTRVALGQEYVTAARTIGARDVRIMARHIAPNIINLLIVQAATLMSTAIVIEAGLSFLGAGVRPPQATWGGMLRDAYGHLELAPTVVLFPALAITLLVVSLNVMSDAVRDWLDPRSRSHRATVAAEQT